MKIKKAPLSSCRIGSVVTIHSLNHEGQMRRRLLDLGFVKGAEVEVLQKSPLGDPVAYRISNTTIALRKQESEKIIVLEGVKAYG